MANLSIQQHRPWRVPALIGLLLILAASGAFYAYDEGWKRGTTGRGDAIAMHDQAIVVTQRKEKRIEELKQENKRLSLQLARVSQNFQVEQQAVSECKKDLTSLQSGLIGKSEKVAFYKRIVSPKDGQSGLRLDDLGFKRSAIKGIYHYKATLIQTLRHDRDTSGSVTMFLTGLQDGELRSLTLADVSITNTSSHRYRFKYHQTFKGDIKIPKGFAPLRLELRIRPAGRAAAISQTFDWTEVAG